MKWTKSIKQIGHKFVFINAIIKAVRGSSYFFIFLDISAQTKNALNDGYYQVNGKK